MEIQINTKMIHINEEDAKKIEQYWEVMQKGYYVQSHMVTALHNKIFDKNMPNTNCGTCLRKKINDLWKELQRQISKASVEVQENKTEEVQEDKATESQENNAEESQENNAEESQENNVEESQENKAEEKHKEENKDGSGGSPQKTKGRKKKSGSLQGQAGEGQGV